MHKNKFSIIIALILVFTFSEEVFAQDGGSLPVYIVQPGENLTEIAQKFNISLQELINANTFVDVNLISAGTQLFIPGLEDVSGVLITEPVNFGDNLRNILLKNNLNLENFLKLNPLTSPSEIFIGSTLVLPQKGSEYYVLSNIAIGNEDSLLTKAVEKGKNPWFFSLENNTKPAHSLPGDVFFYPGGETADIISVFSEKISRIEVGPLPVSQGHTAAIYIYAIEPGAFSGSVGENTLVFYQNADQGYYYALNGISAIAEPGLIPLKISGEFENGEKFAVEQNLLITSGGYRSENLSVEQTTVEQDVIQSENQQIQQILSLTSSDRFWGDSFRFPVDGSLVDDTIAFSSTFGSRRSYNNGQYTGYHGGLDFSVVLMSLNIYAPAPGKVIYTGQMNIRGNTLFIDHGQGVVSGYAHMQEFKVNLGDMVEEGQLIGLIGKTGRVTGPHLHWDLFINGTPVDPFDWVENRYP